MAYALLADLKLELGITVTTDDTLLGQKIAEAQAIIDQQTGRTFEAAADTTRSFDVYAVDRHELVFDAPLAALTSILNGDGTTIATNTVTLLPRNQTPAYGLRLRYDQAFLFTDPDAVITVTGKWASATAAPADIKRACIRIAAWLYRLKDAQVFDATANPDTGQVYIPKGMPVDVAMLLKTYRRRM